MEIDKIKHIASVAKLEFSDSEIERFSNEFNETLNMIDEISKIDLGDIDPTVYVNEYDTHLRNDEVEKSFTQDESLANTLESKYGYMKIVRVVE